MWNRGELKDQAKGFLSEHYWKAFLVCLIVTIFSNTGSNNSGANSGGVNHGVRIGPNNSIFKFFTDRLGIDTMFDVSVGMALLIIVLLTILFITIGAVLEVGKSRFFLEGFKGDAEIGNLFFGFNSGEYLDIVKTQFLSKLYILLWSILLIIPGVIKSYEYRMVPYILAEDPNLPSSEAIRRSSELTDGHKWDMFVLDLSFIGWDILGALLFGIGGMFVTPYKVATVSKLYNALSNDEDRLFEN